MNRKKIKNKKKEKKLLHNNYKIKNKKTWTTYILYIIISLKKFLKN